ncbi:MAG: Ribosomal large subunit pseudouridine synthase B [Desulfovibrio sp.]
MKNDTEKELLRLNKAIAHSGLASRRAADSMIVEGRVSVNGETVTEPGTRIDPQKDAVRVDGSLLTLAASEQRAYFMLHKPVEVVSTAKDPQGRKTVLDLLPPALAKKRLYPVGRLDYFSEGLLLLTDDGEITLRLTHPRYHLPKTYRVTVREKPSEAMLETMRRGMTLAEGEKLAPVKARQLEEHGNHIVEMTLNQGINRQIRRMCRDLGLTILRLVRIRSGPLALGTLPAGKTRELTPEEVAALKKAVGL